MSGGSSPGVTSGLKDIMGAKESGICYRPLERFIELENQSLNHNEVGTIQSAFERRKFEIQRLWCAGVGWGRRRKWKEELRG